MYPSGEGAPLLRGEGCESAARVQILHLRQRKTRRNAGFSLFMRVFLLFVLCTYCSFLRFSAFKVHRKYTVHTFGATALLLIKQCAFLSAFGSLLLHRRATFLPTAKGLAVLGAGRHAQGAGRIGDDQAGNVPYAVAGKAAPQRSASGQRRSGSRI